MNESNAGSAASSPHYDVAIVGGGIGGIYSGWRLITATPDEAAKLKCGPGRDGKLKVAVFEGSDRIGGRLLSARPASFSGTTTCEIGGMRYMSSQTLVRSLVENELKLPRYEQVVDQPANIVYLRGKQLRFSQVQNPSALPFNLDWAEAEFVSQNNPSGLLGWAIAKLLPKVNSLTGDALHQYLRSDEAMVDGTPLYEHGFWNLLARALSPEGYALARSLVGYDCLGSNANAVDLISEYFDFTPGVTYSLLNQGYDSVPWTLQKQFEDAGGELMRNAWVTGFDEIMLGDKRGVVLHFDGRPSVTARAIILALPRRSLELLRREGPVLDPKKAPAHVQEMLGSVRPIPLYKLFVAYKYPWWTSVGVRQGRSLTDTPVRQLYYWPVDPSAPVPSASGNALLMAYNDATNVDFWAGLSGVRTKSMHNPAARRLFRRLPPGVRMFKPPQSAIEPAAPVDEFSARLYQNWTDHPAPHEMVMEMHRQLKQMHNIQYAPKPYDAAFMDWSVDPYGGGVHFWNRGYKSWEILQQMTEPVAGFPCYICGEAYSTNQTWVEGALQTAEIVLGKLGLSAPSWVTPNRA